MSILGRLRKSSWTCRLLNLLDRSIDSVEILTLSSTRLYQIIEFRTSALQPSFQRRTAAHLIKVVQGREGRSQPVMKLLISSNSGQHLSGC